MRLYRALLKEEKILDSDKRAFVDDINILNEAYSHIVKTYNLDYPKSRKIIYSFTDDINIALSIIEKNSDYYDRVCYIDVNDVGFLDDENIKFVYPLYEYEHWINLATYSSDDINNIEIQCLNYKSQPKKLIGTLVPSENGALSWARGAREYAVICKNLIPKVLTAEELEQEKNKINSLLKARMLSSDYEKRNKVIEKLLNDTDKLNIQSGRKKVLKLELERLKK